MAWKHDQQKKLRKQERERPRRFLNLFLYHPLANFGQVAGGLVGGIACKSKTPRDERL